MTDEPPVRRYRFGAFEVDTATGELRRQGIRIKINAQPFQVLCMLLKRPGGLLTREEISSELWPDGTFVDYDHGVNSAINRIREALGDSASSPRFVETLARRGYRFVAAVEPIICADGPAGESLQPVPSKLDASGEKTTVEVEPDLKVRSRILASPQDLPKTSHFVVETLFIVLQIMYLGFYVGALANLAEIEELISPLPKAGLTIIVLMVTAALLIPVRTFVLCAVIFHAPGARKKLLTLWQFLLPLDQLWSLSPFLLLHHINFGVALSCTALLVYSPFAQRSLILMGAGSERHRLSATML